MPKYPSWAGRGSKEFPWAAQSKCGEGFEADWKGECPAGRNEMYALFRDQAAGGNSRPAADLQRVKTGLGT